MKRVKLSYFIAKKISSLRQNGKSTISVKIATISIAISIIVMVISSAVVVGFREDISERLFDFSADFQIVEVTNVSYANDKSISSNNNYINTLKENELLSSVSEFVFKTALLKSETDVKGFGLKGIGADFDWRELEKYLIDGEILNVGDSVREKKILISKKIADQLSVSVGDKIEAIYFSKPPRRDIFSVGGIYSSNISEIDNSLVFCDIRDLQRVNGWGADVFTGYDLYLKNAGDYKQALLQIDKAISNSSSSLYRQEALVDTRDRYDYIFGWFELLRNNEVVIIVIMIIVSLFNVVSMVLIILLQKTSMIGVLKSLGMRDSYIELIFVFRGMKELISGVIYGNVIAIVLCLLQKKYEIIKLDGNNYMVSSVPISLEVDRILFVNVLLLTVLFVSQLFATKIVTKMEPYKAIKYEKR